MKLASYVSGKWVEGSDEGAALVDPVTGAELARASTTGIDIAAAMAYARETGGPALRSLSFAERGGLLKGIADTLTANRDSYFEIAQSNSGNTKVDAAIDIDGGIGTIKYFARLGESLGGRQIHQGRPLRPAGQGRGVPGHAPVGAAPRRRHPHQRLQFPVLGPVGKGRGGAALGRAGAGQAGDRHGVARPADGQGRDRGRRAAGGRARHPVRGGTRTHRQRHRPGRDRLHRLGGYRQHAARPPESGRNPRPM